MRIWISKSKFLKSAMFINFQLNISSFYNRKPFVFTDFLNRIWTRITTHLRRWNVGFLNTLPSDNWRTASKAQSSVSLDLRASARRASGSRSRTLWDGNFIGTYKFGFGLKKVANCFVTAADCSYTFIPATKDNNGKWLLELREKCSLQRFWLI